MSRFEVSESGGEVACRFRFRCGGGAVACEDGAIEGDFVSRFLEKSGGAVAAALGVGRDVGRGTDGLANER